MNKKIIVIEGYLASGKTVDTTDFSLIDYNKYMEQALTFLDG